MENMPLIRASATLVVFKLIVVCYASVHVVSSLKLGDEACPLPVSDVVVTRMAHKQGFHRNVLTDVSAVIGNGGGDCQQCTIRLVEFLPEGMYVDTYQMKALKDFGSPQVLAFEEIDVEKPEYLSPNHTIYVYSHDAKLANDQLTASIDLPVHLRYHLPSEDNDVRYSLVYLPSPDVFVYCAGCSKDLICSSESSGSVVRASCTAENKSLCGWTQLVYKGTETDLRFEVPVGQASLSMLITVVTLAAIMMGTVVLIWTSMKENTGGRTTKPKPKPKQS